MSDTTRKNLVEAIRRFTVDQPDGAPNSDTEALFIRLRKDLQKGDLKEARSSFRFVCAALAADTKALLDAANAHLGGDFNAPAAPPDVVSRSIEGALAVTIDGVFLAPPDGSGRLEIGELWGALFSHEGGEDGDIGDGERIRITLESVPRG